MPFKATEIMMSLRGAKRQSNPEKKGVIRPIPTTSLARGVTNRATLYIRSGRRSRCGSVRDRASRRADATRTRAAGRRSCRFARCRGSSAGPAEQGRFGLRQRHDRRRTSVARVGRQPERRREPPTAADNAAASTRGASKIREEGLRILIFRSGAADGWRAGDSRQPAPRLNTSMGINRLSACGPRPGGPRGYCGRRPATPVSRPRTRRNSTYGRPRP